MLLRLLVVESVVVVVVAVVVVGVGLAQSHLLRESLPMMTHGRDNLWAFPG